MAELDKIPPDNGKTYSGFLGYTKWLIVLVVIVLGGMAMFLTR